MKKGKKILSLLVALVMILGTFSPAVFAAEVSNDPNAVTQTVTLHKMLMSKDDFGNFTQGQTGINGEEYVGNKVSDINSYFGSSAIDAGGIFFAVKNADGTQYVSADGSTLLPADFVLTKENQSEVMGGLTEKGVGIEFNTANLKGEYLIVEMHDLSTYVGAEGAVITDAKAVPVEITLPLVNNDGTVLNAHVYPKNTEDKPTLEKDIVGQDDNTPDALEPSNDSPERVTLPKAVGDTVPYVVTTTVPAQSKWATAFWSDKMTEGLTFNKDSFTITYNGTTMDSSWYTLSTTADGFDLTLTKEGFAGINNQEAEATIVINYSATLNSNAVVAIPESNDITFHYGNEPSQGNTPVPNKPDENGELTVTKTWAEGALPYDATFTLYNAQTGQIVTAEDVVAVEGYTFTNPVSTQDSYTWKGLDKDVEYKVVESYKAGYTAWYNEVTAAGQIAIENRVSNNPEPLNPNVPNVETYGAKFVKTDQEGTRLTGAEFVVYRKTGSEKEYLTGTSVDRAAFNQAQKEYEAAIEGFNANDGTTQADVDAAKLARDNAWTATLENMTAWGPIDSALKLTSNDLGQFEIAGLAPGTYGLEETKAPEGYAKIADIEFVINGDGQQATKNIDFNPESELTDAQQVINKKVTIPETGGIGTAIFTVAGLALMGGAAVAMKRNKDEDEE